MNATSSSVVTGSHVSSSEESLTPKRKRAIVIGASSGIGAACVRELVAQGYLVALLARREDRLQAIAEPLNARAGGKVAHVFAHDVQDTAGIPALLDQCCETLGGCDVVLYATGILWVPEADGYDTDKDMEEIAINVTGAVAWLNEAAGLFTRLGGGTLIGISSVAAERGRRRAPVYGATKAFLSHYLEALRNRLSQHGVRVVTILPGYVESEMTAGMGKLLWLISAEEAARRIIGAISGGPEVLYVPRRWGLLMFILRIIPSEIFRHLNV